MTLTTGVYFASETLQLSPLISDSSHYKPTVYTFSYDLLYSWLVSFAVLKINDIVVSKYPSDRQIIGYALAYYVGAIGFALLGEIPCLHDLVIVPGFWDHLQPCAKLTILFFAGIIGILGLYQCRQAWIDRDCGKHLIPYLIFVSCYGLVLMTLVYGEASNINIHVHHAIGAAILSFWFTDWNNYPSMLCHGVMMGVVVEGIDFYGIGELSLFLCNNGTLMEMSYMVPILIVWSMCSLCLYRCFGFGEPSGIKPKVLKI